MATIITSLILWGFMAAVLGLIGKLIYDIQQSKKQEKKSNDEFADKDSFQKLAGITPVDKNDEIRQILAKNNLNGDKLVEELKKEFQNSEFPAPDQSIPVVTAKLTTIGGSYEDKDPLASVPMSRVSKEAKQKMAEIAKQDISNQLEQNADKFSALFPNELQSELPKEIKEAMMKAPMVKPKRKYTKKPKQ